MGRTLGVAGGVALFCSLIVSMAVYWLRPIQAAYDSIERNRAIVAAAGLEPGDGASSLSDREIVDLYLAFEERLVDLDRGRFLDAGPDRSSRYDYRAAISDSALTVPIAPARDGAGIGRRPRSMPVYLMPDVQSIERLVLPVYGRGMWSVIHGFIGLGPDLNTITGVHFYEHGETPGIGDRIQRPGWTAQWRAQRMYSEDGVLVFGIGASSESGNGIDALTGATVTVTGVDRMVRYWFGEDGYGPFLSRLRSRVP